MISSRLMNPSSFRMANPEMALSSGTHRPSCSRTAHGLGRRAAAPAEKTSLPFTPAFCAAVQAAEAVKLLCGRPAALEGKLLLADLRWMDWSILTV